MASRCEVRLHAPDASTASAWAEAAIAEVRRDRGQVLALRDDSVTTAINRGAGCTAVSVDDETGTPDRLRRRVHAQSQGRFDLTSGVLRRVWDFKVRRVRHGLTSTPCCR